MALGTETTVFDMAVIGAGPAGCQAAVSAAHQTRHVALVDGGAVSLRRGRHFWAKSVKIVDAPVFPGITGPALNRSLQEWIAIQPERDVSLDGRTRRVGIRRLPAFVTNVDRNSDGTLAITIATSILPGNGAEPPTETFAARTLVVASGFEDAWPDIEVDLSAERTYQRYGVVFRYAGNRRGWHVCVRCDGHLHLDQTLAIVGVGDYIFDVVHGAQDFTRHMTVFTNGRPHGMSEGVLAEMTRRGIELETERIEAHIGAGRDLLGLRLADGRELYYDGFFMDEGLQANDAFLAGFNLQHSEDGLLVCDADRRLLDTTGHPIPGIWACGDIVAGERNLIAAAFASGQDAALQASDTLRRWPYVA
jgi:thioredoxin reductase